MVNLLVHGSRDEKITLYMMRILIVCRYKEKQENNIAPFIWEQMEAISRSGISTHLLQIKKSGFQGYIASISKLYDTIREYQPDIIHAHYGLCGLLSNMQRHVPVVTTYHGSDINNPKVRLLSTVSIRLSALNIFVSKKLVELVNPGNHYTVIPCGINLDDYPEIEKGEAREGLGLSEGKKYILFAGAFDNAVKNYPLAKAAVELIPDTELIELKGYNRHQVALLMNAADCLLMTSHTEGSPQVIKEAMACGCPIVSVDVGDVCEEISETNGCHIAKRDAEDIAEKVKLSLSFEGKTDGRMRIQSLKMSNPDIAAKLIAEYIELI